MKLTLKGKLVASQFGIALIGGPMIALYLAVLFKQTGTGFREGVQDVLMYEIYTLGVVIPLLSIIHNRFSAWILRPIMQYFDSPEKTQEMASAALKAADRFAFKQALSTVAIVPLIVMVVLVVITRFLIVPYEEFNIIILGGLGAGVVVSLCQYYYLRFALDSEMQKILADHHDLWKERDKWGFKLNIRRILLVSFISLVVVALILAWVMDYSQARGALLQEIASLKYKDLKRRSLELATLLEDGWKPKAVDEYLSSIDVGSYGYAFLLNKDGEVVSNPREKEINPQIIQRVSGIERGKHTGRRIVISPLSEREEYFLASESDGLSMAAYSILQDHGLALAAVYPWEDYKGSIAGMRRVSTFVILITLGFCAGIAYLVAHSVSRPMDSTLSFIKAISEGKLTEDIVVMPAHEVG
ncbi:MAG: hypothetical protein JSU92_05915, partial [Deltaproteobacteria bacterium]